LQIIGFVAGYVAQQFRITVGCIIVGLAIALIVRLFLSLFFQIVYVAALASGLRTRLALLEQKSLALAKTKRTSISDPNRLEIGRNTPAMTVGYFLSCNPKLSSLPVVLLLPSTAKLVHFPYPVTASCFIQRGFNSSQGLLLCKKWNCSLHLHLIR
jgi:hypothetical protein